MFKVKEGLSVGNKVITGSGPTEVLTIGDVGSMAFQNTESFTVGSFSATSLFLDDTASAYNLEIRSTSNTALTADRLLTVDVNNANRILDMGGNISVDANMSFIGSFTSILRVGATTDITLPASGTLAIVGGNIGSPTVTALQPVAGTTTFNLLTTVATTLNVGTNATTLAIGSTGAAITTFQGTAAIRVPNGTDGQRPTAAVGMIRYSTTSNQFEGYSGTAWSSIGGATITNDTTTNTTYYPLFATTSSGSATAVKVCSSKLTFNPSTGTLYATEFLSSSDLALKTDIQEIKSPISIINQLVGKSFSWKNTDEKTYGLIAQELEQVLPELVVDNNGSKSVKYTALIALLIEAVKELNWKVDNGI
jgi:hypothetical protein